MDRKMLHPLKDIYLLPFYLLAALFLVVCKPHINYPPETVSTAILKILPILALAGYVFLSFNNATKYDGLYSNFFLYGILISALGDICLVWRETLILPGAMFFAIAHTFYILGLVQKYTGSQHKLLFLYLGLASFLFIVAGIDCYLDLSIIFVYNGLVTSVAFLAVARFEKERSVPSMWGAIGGLLFMFSDFIIGVDKWRFGILGAEGIVMLTYYSAQLGLALSTVK